MKRKSNRRKLIRIRPVKRATRVYVEDTGYAQDLIDFIASEGYLLYEDPTDENFLIISDRPITYRSFRDSQLNQSGKWFDETYADQMSEELQEYRW